jgi:hypothetical protein
MTGLRHFDESTCLGDIDAEAWRRILELRGGCACHVSPPCQNCFTPLTEDELNGEGYTLEKPAKGDTA